MVKKFFYNKFLIVKYIFGKIKKYWEGQEKSFTQKLLDLISWELREHDFNTMYYAFGLHLVGRDIEAYIGRREILSIKNAVERVLTDRHSAAGISYDVITKDKFYCGLVLSALNIPCIPNKGLIVDGEIYIDEKKSQLTDLMGLAERFVLKSPTEEAGEGVFVIDQSSGSLLVNGRLIEIDQLQEIISSGIFIYQNYLSSHKVLMEISSSALNTLRVVTILDQGVPIVLGGFHGFATSGATTDSWSGGSIYVGVDFQRGSLKKYGLLSLSDSRGGLIETHPDSGVRFDGFSLPFIDESLNICLEAHKYFYNNFLIGWDVAVTDQGPLIVEVNEKPGMNVIQCFEGGLREKIRDCANYYLMNHRKRT